jgi:putative nucleotidyltransferase with HDIG domain
VSEQVEGRNERWLAHSRAGLLVSALSFAIPVVLSIGAVFGASKLLPHPTTDLERALWWVAVLLIAWIAAVLGERLARPLLPLASLLRMSLLFPDRAPSRFAVAWRSGSTRQLDRYVHGHDQSGHREPLEAATQILVMVTALSSHDRRTRGHSERVRAYTDLIADELRLPQPDRDRLRWAALLHDVGKISVDVDILNKSGAPSPAEWEILHRHPIEGSRMIEPLRAWLGEWGLAVEQHHENFDGSGYPYGIAGDQISLGARIVAVADSFEVMTAARSYKSPMSP